MDVALAIYLVGAFGYVMGLLTGICMWLGCRFDRWAAVAWDRLLRRLPVPETPEEAAE